MTVVLDKLNDYKKSGDTKSFNDVLMKFLPQLKKVIRFKLRNMEKNGFIPRNMYSPQEIVDEVYLKIFEEFDDELNDESRLKVKMFKIAKEILDDIRSKHTGKKISTELLLRDEMKELEEEYTVDADGDFVMIEELDDISYHLDDFKEKILLLDASEVGELAEDFGLLAEVDNGKLTDSQVQNIDSVFSNLPELAQSVISHFSFGKLNIDEIAEIHGIDTDSVKEVIEKVKVRFKKVL